MEKELFVLYFEVSELLEHQVTFLLGLLELQSHFFLENLVFFRHPEEYLGELVFNQLEDDVLLVVRVEFRVVQRIAAFIFIVERDVVGLFDQNQSFLEFLGIEGKRGFPHIPVDLLFKLVNLQVLPLKICKEVLSLLGHFFLLTPQLRLQLLNDLVIVMDFIRHSFRGLFPERFNQLVFFGQLFLLRLKAL